MVTPYTVGKTECVKYECIFVLACLAPLNRTSNLNFPLSFSCLLRSLFLYDYGLLYVSQ